MTRTVHVARAAMGALVLATFVRADAAQAVCIAQDPTVEWTFPQDGQEDVPFDAHVFVATSDGVDPFEVLLDGAPLVAADVDRREFVMSVNAPSSEHELVVRLRSDRPDLDHVVRFTTGVQPTTTLLPRLRIVAHEVDARFELERSCWSLVIEPGCHDGPGSDHHVFETDEPAPFLTRVWRVQPNGDVVRFVSPWRADCGAADLPVARQHDDPGEVCVRLDAVAENGRVVEGEPRCSRPDGEGGCAQTRGSAFLGAFAALLVSSRARRRRPAATSTTS